MISLRPFILLMLASSANADWRTDIGWDELGTWTSLNGVDLPDTSTVFVGMTEAEQGADNLSIYSPDPNDAQISDVTINDPYGLTDTFSGHATGIAKLFFGNTTSISPDVLSADVYGVNVFLDKASKYNDSWQAEVMSHAYVGSFSDRIDPETLEVLETKESQSERFCRDFDYTAYSKNILHLCGANNGASSNLQHIWSHAYNNITVGRTDGLHSAGSVQNGFHGAGRQKPEMVMPMGYTSSSTGALSSLATVLKAHSKGHDNSTNASKALTLKSILLAGAKKEIFSDWDNTSTRPIDEIYGAGEANILNSFRILNAPETPPGNTTNLYGWDYDASNDSSEIQYTITIPPHATAATISTNLSWNRAFTTARVKGQTVPTGYDTLADFSLTLKDGNDLIVFTSDSAYDNLEHIWQTDLSPGDYKLCVKKKSGNDTDYALAWRVDIETNTTPTSFTQVANSNNLIFSDLAPQHKYTLQRSSGLSTWVDVTTGESLEDGSLSFSDPNSSLGEKVFYRLRYYSP